jgi:uncharacterized protein (TIGR03066 family)
MRAVLCCVLGLFLCGGLTAEDKKDAKIDAAKLVGKWEPKDKKEGISATVEFTKDGKVTLIVSRDGKEMKAEGTYKVDGNKVTMELKQGDMEVKLERTVTKLTDTEMTTADEKGTERTVVRVKDKK